MRRAASSWDDDEKYEPETALTVPISGEDICQMG